MDWGASEHHRYPRPELASFEQVEDVLAAPPISTRSSYGPVTIFLSLCWLEAPARFDSINGLHKLRRATAPAVVAQCENRGEIHIQFDIETL
jgi:hypothetical protein